MLDFLMAFSEAGQKRVPGWIVAWGVLGVLAVVTTVRRSQGRSRIAEFGFWMTAAAVMGLAAGAGKLFVGHFTQRSAETADWPSVPGVVTRSTWRHSERHSTSRSDHQYLDLRYRYEVAGVTREGNQVTRDNVRTNGDDERWAQLYPVGKEISVRYNPADPNEAVLEMFSDGDGPISTPMVFFLFGVSLLLLGVWENVLHGPTASMAEAAGRN